MSKLINDLAADLTPVRPARTVRITALAAAIGAAVSLGVLLLVYGARPDFLSALGTLGFWAKLTLTLGLFAVMLPASARLSVPGGQARWWGRAAGGLVLVFALGGVIEIAMTAPESRMELWLGHSWNECPFWVAGLALPIFASTMLAMRRLAPVDLKAAGLAAGLMSGAAGASVYAIACNEYSLAFMASWYVAGIALSGLAGFIAGPFLLRW